VGVGLAGPGQSSLLQGRDRQAVGALSMSGRPRGVKRPASTARLRPSGAWPRAPTLGGRTGQPLADDKQTCVGSLVVAPLTDTERRALAIVMDLDGRRSAVIVAQVAGELGHAATSANRILRTLEGRGFALREVDHNQNAEVIFATQAGRDAFDA
jgi:hypothetical protein